MSKDQPNQPLHDTAGPLRSTLSTDPDMVDLVRFFVLEMDDRVESINSAARRNDLGELRTLAHQLKGSATGYGFSPISTSAGVLEQLIDAADPSAEVASLRDQVDELIELCRRAAI